MFGKKNMILYKKICENLDLPYDAILTNLNVDRRIVNTPNGSGPPIQNQGECWQYYDYGQSLLRNWSRHDLIDIVFNKLKVLRDSVRDEYSLYNNPMLNRFLDAKFNSFPAMVPIKVINDLDPHRDGARTYALTIGLTEGTHETFVSNATSLEEFNSSEKQSYIVNKGDVYITQVKTWHSVVRVDKSHLYPRYTISYSIK